MRFVVLFFGLLGVTLTAFVGAMFFMPEVYLKTIEDLGASKDMIAFAKTSPTGAWPGDAAPILALAAGLGFLGVMLSFFRCGWQGALLMLIPPICTSIMNWHTAVFTGLLAFAGLLSFLVFPLPLAAPKTAGNAKDKDDDDDDDDD